MKTIENTVTQAWQKQSWYLWLLLPLMVLYWLAVSIHKGLYTVGFKKPYKATIPVMVIGNITVGGSGKTPLLIALVEYLTQNNIIVAVISRGYGSNNTHARLVGVDSCAHDVGDEPCLIKQATNVPVCVGSNRAQSIELIQKHYPNTQLILSDDGLQHYKLHYDSAFIVYDAKRGLGNKMLLPVGFLREWASRLKDNNKNEVVIYHGDAQQIINFSLEIQDLQPILTKDTYTKKTCQTKPLSHHTIHAVTGIGYPLRFFNTLRDLGYQVIEHPFPDHHKFVVSNLQFTEDLPLVVTTKDAIKIQNLQDIDLMNIWVLPVKAKLSNGCYHELKKQLKHMNIDISEL